MLKEARHPRINNVWYHLHKTSAATNIVYSRQRADQLATWQAGGSKKKAPHVGRGRVYMPTVAVATQEQWGLCASSIMQARNEDSESTAGIRDTIDREMDGENPKGRQEEERNIQRQEKLSALMFFSKLSQDHCPPPSTKHPSRIPPPAIRISPPVPLIHKPCIHTCSTRPESKPLTRPQGPLLRPLPHPGTTCSGAFWLSGAALQSAAWATGSLLHCFLCWKPSLLPSSWTRLSSCLHTPDAALLQTLARVSSADVTYGYSCATEAWDGRGSYLFTVFNIWHSTGLNKSFSWGETGQKSISETDTKEAYIRGCHCPQKGLWLTHYLLLNVMQVIYTSTVKFRNSFCN